MESTEPIPEAPGDTWTGIDSALKYGRRGLKGISSVARLLEEYGKKPNRPAMPPLSNRKILAGADAYFARTGKWPNVNSGPVAEAPGEDWEWIDQSRRVGTGHLPGGSSLLQLLARKRGVRNPYDMPPLSAEQILAWADAHIQRTGKRPKYDLGPVLDAPGETWAGIDGAVRHGRRSLPVGLPPAKRKGPVAGRGAKLGELRRRIGRCWGALGPCRRSAFRCAGRSVLRVEAHDPKLLRWSEPTRPRHGNEKAQGFWTTCQ